VEPRSRAGYEFSEQRQGGDVAVSWGGAGGEGGIGVALTARAQPTDSLRGTLQCLAR
jgi:hypothetical protein